MLLQIISSLLLGSSLAKVIASNIVEILPFSLFSTSIPGVTDKLVSEKTFDLVDFVLMIVLSFALFLLLNFLKSYKRKSQERIFFELYLVSFSLIIFVQTHFIEFSGKSVLSLLASFLGLYFVLPIIFKIKKYPDKFVLANAMLLGLNLMFIANNFSTSFAFPVLVLILTIVFYSILSQKDYKFLQNPVHLLLSMSIFVSANSLHLFVILAIYGISLAVSRNIVLVQNSKIRSYLYPAVIIFVIFYNPLYYIGNLDSIEEGFWLSWLERLTKGSVIYRDFFAYHPPFIIWGLGLFSNIFGASVAGVRLYMHLLQIVGLIIIYFVLESLLKRKQNIYFALLIIAALTTTTFVRNNSEIRIAVGLLPLLFYWMKKNGKLAGVFTSVTVFISIETGMASFIAMLVSIAFVERSTKKVLRYILFCFLGALPIILYLGVTNSLIPMFSQTSDYAKAFSAGYFNLALERSIQTSYFRWHLFYEYLSSNAFYWEASKMILIGSLIYIFIKGIAGFPKITDESKLSEKEKYIFAISVYGLLLFRSALGRSDFHHLLFVLVVSVILVFYLIEQLPIATANVAVTILLLLVFVKPINARLLSDIVFKFTTHGEVIGEYQALNLDRSGILVDKEFNKTELEQVVNYVKENVDDDQSFFAFPWSPELYLLADRNNSTSFDTPYAFFEEKNQKKMIDELKSSDSNVIVYDTSANFGGLTPDALKEVNDYIEANYNKVDQIQSYKIYEK